jgi:hypothetical protein
MKKSVPAASPDAYVAALSGWRRTCVERLRSNVLAAAKVAEMIKWGNQMTLRRAVSFALLALAAALPAPAAAQSPELVASDYLLFQQGVMARQTARTCARGIPGYRQKFDALYRRWSEKHGQRLRRGQAVLQEALARQDDPNIDREQLQQVQRSAAQLSQPPPNPTPLELDERQKARCAATLAELEAGLK